MRRVRTRRIASSNTNATTRNLLAVRLTGFRIRNLAGGRVGNAFNNTNCRV